MCLVVDKELTKNKFQEFKKKNRKEIVFYKILRIHNENSELWSPYQDYVIDAPREYVERSRVQRSKNYCMGGWNKIVWIDGGCFHAYCTETKARMKLDRSWFEDGCVISIRVRIEDIVAFGMDDVCFKKFKISQRTWKKIFKKRKAKK